VSADDSILSESVEFEKAREMDERLPDDQVVKIAFRKLVTRVGADLSEDIGPMEATYRTITTIDQLAQRVAELEDRVDKADRAADTALTLAEQQAEPGDSVSKKRVALLKTRNELVRRAANQSLGNSVGLSLTYGEVEEMAKPETKLHYHTVKDAWDELAAEWGAFSVGENESGDRVCRLRPDELDPRLVKAIESSLDRDDLTKRLLSDAQRRGV